MACTPSLLRLASDLKQMKQDPPEVRQPFFCQGCAREPALVLWLDRGSPYCGLVRLRLSTTNVILTLPPPPLSFPCRLPPPQGCSANPVNEDNLYVWAASVFGPDETPFEGVCGGCRPIFAREMMMGLSSLFFLFPSVCPHDLRFTYEFEPVVFE